MARSAAQKAAARFRQLSCLGLAKEIAIPEMLRELHAIIPSFYNSFFFADERGSVNNAYFEHTDLLKTFPIYAREFHETRERDFKGFSFSDGVRTQFGVHEFGEAVPAGAKAFQRSDLWNVIFRPMGNDNNFLRLYFREGRRVLGGVTMWRSKTAHSWTAVEKHRLGSLESFFIHALTAPSENNAPLVDDVDTGFVIADTAGKPISFSTEGRRLLYLSSRSSTISGSASDRSVSLPAPVAALCQRLARIYSDDMTASAPTYRHENVWGGFTFRAQWMDEERSPSGSIGITIRHNVPLPVRLMRSVKALPLSARQAEVCLLIAIGTPNDVIAERLGVSRHTANEHARWVYNKLDVHSRPELMRKLLASPEGSP